MEPIGSELSQPRQGQFACFSIERLVDNSITDFDLFIALERHFILYSGTGYQWNRAELTELLGAGHDQFFIRRGDLPKAAMYETLSSLPAIENGLPPSERIQSIEQVGAKFIQCVFEGELTEGCVHKAETIAQSMVDCIGEDRTCVRFLGELADRDYYTYYHSVRVAAYSVSIALGMGLRDEGLLRSMALGGMFHDIGKKDVPLQMLNKRGPLNENEWKVMRSHPVRGLELVNQTILSHVPREIVIHHHEKLNGTGYPHGLGKRELIYEVQIATLADVFDALTSSRSYQNKRTRFEALDFIKHKLLKEEVCPDAFKALVTSLAT